jgi:hypothetical protein
LSFFSLFSRYRRAHAIADGMVPANEEAMGVGFFQKYKFDAQSPNF